MHHPSKPLIGTCAWSYDDWRGVFYPEHLPAGERLAFFARHFGTVEIDSTFYHAPAPHVSEHWAEATPPEFVFSAKLPRLLTHEQRLRDWQGPLAAFLEGIAPLHGKLGAVLIQLPPFFHPRHDETALRDFIRHLPAKPRFAVEFRDPAWHLPRIAHLLEEHRVCWAWNDTTTPEHAGEAPFGFWPKTADFLYVRLLGDLETKYHADGSRIHQYRQLQWPRTAALDGWAEKIRVAHAQVERTFVYTANHFEGLGPATAARLAERLGQPVALPSADELAGRDTRQLTLL